MRILPVALLALAAPLGAQQQQPVVVAPPQPSIVASGRGEVKVTPDRATVHVTVETRGKTAAIAGNENARIVRVTLDALRAQGLTNEQLGTADYNVYPEQTYDERTRRPVILGYVARNTVRAEVRRIEKVGDVIDAALAGGANTIGGVHFWSSSLEAARRTALEQAVGASCRDAAAMARGAGRALGQPLEISSVESYMPPPMPMMQARAAAPAMAEAVPTQVNPGEQSLVVSVTARWAFAQDGANAGSAAVPACAR